MGAIFGFYQVVVLVLLLSLCVCADEDVCDRRPLDTNAAALPADNRFLIDIKNIRGNMYIPKQEYEVRLFSRDNTSTFIAFTISVRGDSKKNKNNARRPIMLKPGTLELIPGSNNTKRSRTCENTIIQSDITPKLEVKVNWIAPDKDNKCVTIFAVVAVQPDVWYNYEGPLSKQVCEDRRKADDMLPIENDNCDVCEDARYQLTFEGMWSQNTHPLMYPTTQDLARFSDIVGASHSKDFTLYKTNSEASEGLKMLAEQGNTTKLELEILSSLKLEGAYVRTLIKATASPRPNMSTVTNFRVTRFHHLVSVATALLPSPDWFLGVSNLELCDVATKYWAENVTLNLYPLDAGTDSGKTFESANEETSPPQPITSAVIAKDINKEEIKPFARLLFRLVRTYSMPDCVDQPAGTDNPDSEDGGDGGEDENHEDEEVYHKPEYRPTPAPPTTTSEEPPAVDPETEASDCPMTTWGDWSECDGECIEGTVTGYQTRFRQHMGSPTPECTINMSTEEFQPCEEECEEEQVEEEDYEEEE